LPTSEQTGKITGNVNRFVLNKLLILFYFARKRKRQSLTSPTAMEPLLPGDNKALTDLATDLVAKSNALAGRLHPTIQTGVGDLVRSMNCYYSNLIEGHRTHPVDSRISSLFLRTVVPG
jgi:hypothetical protein